MAWEARRRGTSRPSTAAPRLKGNRSGLLGGGTDPGPGRESVTVHNAVAVASLLAVVRPASPPSPATHSPRPASTSSITSLSSSQSRRGSGSTSPAVPPPPGPPVSARRGPSAGRSALAAAHRTTRVSSAPPTHSSTSLSRPRTASAGRRPARLPHAPSLPFKAVSGGLRPSTASSSSSRPSSAGLGLPPRLPTYIPSSARSGAVSVSDTLQRAMEADSLLSILAGAGAGAGYASESVGGGIAGSSRSPPSGDPHATLCVAADGGKVDAVTQLLAFYGRRPAVVNKGRDVDGYTPLHCACSQGHWAVALVLLAAGADARQVTNTGDTALHMAAYIGSRNTVDVLVDYGADVNAKNEYGEVPLAHAARRGHARVVRQLIGVLGADPLLPDRFDETPAQQAADKLTLTAFESSPRHHGPFGRLPWPAVVLVFEYLDCPSLGRVACVCDKWRRVMDEAGTRLFKAAGGDRGRGKWELSLNSLMGFGAPPMAQFRPPSNRSRRSSGRRTPTPSPTHGSST